MRPLLPAMCRLGSVLPALPEVGSTGGRLNPMVVRSFGREYFSRIF